MNTMTWFAKPAFDAPELHSPQPCPRGVACDYKRKNAEGVLVPAFCNRVHPGEEGNGRRFFEAKTLDDGTVLQPCVRLTGCHRNAGGGYPERRKARMSWRDWAALHGLTWDVTAGPVAVGGVVAAGRSHRRAERVDLRGGTAGTDTVTVDIGVEDLLREAVSHRSSTSPGWNAMLAGGGTTAVFVPVPGSAATMDRVD